MLDSANPTSAIVKAAAALPNAVQGASCNQTSFKVGKTAFLYIGPGAKGIGYKAMLKLTQSMPQAEEMASAEPSRYQASSNGWVTIRFTAEEPIPKTIWSKWLKESYAISKK